MQINKICISKNLSRFNQYSYQILLNITGQNNNFVNFLLLQLKIFQNMNLNFYSHTYFIFHNFNLNLFLNSAK